MTKQPIITANGVSKSFEKSHALKEVTFQVNEGEIFGFIGPDGAGKTTLFRILTTLMLPDKGEIQLMGLDCVRDFKEIRKNIGYMPGRFSLYMDLTVEENLNFYATVFGTTLRENYDLIEEIYAQIEPFKKRQAGKLSGGMKQKLALSCALIHKPALLVLDEPTTGVDAVSRAEFWGMLKNLKRHNITVLVSTPYMDEAMQCDRVALIQDGMLLSIDTPEKVRDGFKKKLFRVTANEKYALIKALRIYPNTLTAYPFGDSVHVTFQNDSFDQSIYSFLATHGVENVVVEPARAGIEDRFLELMNPPAAT